MSSKHRSIRTSPSKQVDPVWTAESLAKVTKSIQIPGRHEDKLMKRIMQNDFMTENIENRWEQERK